MFQLHGDECLNIGHQDIDLQMSCKLLCAPDIQSLLHGKIYSFINDVYTNSLYCHKKMLCDFFLKMKNMNRFACSDSLLM